MRSKLFLITVMFLLACNAAHAASLSLTIESLFGHYIDETRLSRMVYVVMKSDHVTVIKREFIGEVLSEQKLFIVSAEDLRDEGGVLTVTLENGDKVVSSTRASGSTTLSLMMRGQRSSIELRPLIELKIESPKN